MSRRIASRLLEDRSADRAVKLLIAVAVIAGGLMWWRDGPNVVPRAIGADAAVPTGGVLTVTMTARNTGGRGASDWRVSLQLLRGRSDVVVGTPVLPHLPAHAQWRVHPSVTLPATVRPGVYRLVACTLPGGDSTDTRGCATASRTVSVLDARRDAALFGRWRPTPGFEPLSDAQAAAGVRPMPENRPANASANAYVPSAREIRRFRESRDRNDETPEQRNPYLGRVTGGYTGTTDEIIQWGGLKWGIPPDWLRAQFVNESGWHQSARGDETYVGMRALGDFPEMARERDAAGAYTGAVSMSLGISQVKWTPDGSVHAGTEPLRWRSTAFAVDYEAATVRMFYDDPEGRRTAWNDPTYRPGDPWLSMGGWYRPYPWRNRDQLAYVRILKRILAARPWTAPNF